MRRSEIFPLAVVAFLDILGFANMVARDCDSAEAPEYLPKVLSVLESMEGIVGDDVSLTQFSDSVVLAVPYSISGALRLISVVSELQYHFAVSGILLRGGVSLGRHHASPRLVYSNGVVKAYRLESEHARYPRVLIDPNIVDLVQGTGTAEELARLSTLVLIDQDQRLFVDYLASHDTEKHAKAIRDIVAQAPRDIGVLEKMHWLAKYHQYCSGEGPTHAELGLLGIRRWGQDK